MPPSISPKAPASAAAPKVRIPAGARCGPRPLLRSRSTPISRPMAQASANLSHSLSTITTMKAVLFGAGLLSNQRRVARRLCRMKGPEQVVTRMPAPIRKRSAVQEPFSFPEDFPYARQIAHLLRVPLCRISIHQFPDGETLASIGQRRTRSDAILVRRLDHPNPKIVDTLLVADALRRSSARKVTLTVPYFPYLRQDKVFHQGYAL